MEREKPKLLVVSFDGFRWDYLDRLDVTLKNFEKFLENGVRAEVKYWYESFLIQTSIYSVYAKSISNQNFSKPLDHGNGFIRGVSWNYR